MIDVQTVENVKTQLTGCKTCCKTKSDQAKPYHFKKWERARCLKIS